MISEILSNIGNTLSEEIKRIISHKGISNTGETEKSIHYEATENKLKILGNSPPIEQLELGRKPGKFAPVKAIRDWVATKLSIFEEKENKRVAFLVNRKIAMVGTEIYQDNSRGLELKNVKEMGINLIKTKVGEHIRINIGSEINNKLKENLR